jgi:hypothetical protein
MEEEPTLIVARREKIKEQILDDAFKKAEISRGLGSPDGKTHKKRPYEKTFPKLGILIIFLAIIGLVLISRTPWVYIRYDVGKDASFNSNFDNVGNQTLLDLFKSPYYLGLSADDFTYEYSSTFYGFLSLIILGIVITIFGIFDKMRDFSIETFITIHFTFTTIIIIPSTFIIVSGIKILGSHFLFYHNANLISPKLTFLSFPVAVSVVVLGFVIIKLMFTLMRMDFNALQKIKEAETSTPSFPYYSFGGKI